MSTGMNNLIFVCYSNTLDALILLPTSLFFHRSTVRPPINFSILRWFFLLGFLGCVAQFIGYAGINYSSPTLGTAMLNLTPAFTFVLAVIFRKVEYTKNMDVYNKKQAEGDNGADEEESDKSKSEVNDEDDDESGGEDEDDDE